jgi:hypothetical protein
MHIASDMGTVRIVYDGSPFDVLYDIKGRAACQR